MSIFRIHPDFSINKQKYSLDELYDLAYDYIKYGEEYQQHIGSFLMDWIDESEYVSVKTSGSTGKPKKIKLKKEYMINSALATGEFFKIKKKTTALLCLPANYIAGKMMLVRAMVLGWKLDIVPPKMNPLDAVFKQYDFCAMVPLQLDNSLNRLHLIKKLIVGGGKVSAQLAKRVEDVDTKIYETYGMTETITHIAARRINPKDKIVKPFKVLPNVKVSIDERDCLKIVAPNVADMPIITNDIVTLQTYKKFIWKGRYDNVINSGGIKMFPEEIEGKLQNLISQRFIISSIPNEALGNKVILIIESDASRIENNIEKTIRELEVLSKYEIPKEIFYLPKFVETENGKIQRQKTLDTALEAVGFKNI